MPILVDELSVWDISFRWAGYDPRKFYFRIPIAVEDNFRNIMQAIISSEIDCETISLEKRNYEKGEKELSIYFWIDDIYACMWGKYFNRKMLRWARIDRSSFKLWCERMNIPLPEFWFPQGWNLEYHLPEDELHPGHWYLLRDWPEEDRKSYFEAVEANRALNKSRPAEIQAVEKLRPSQETRITCQSIAKSIWKKEPNRTIASLVKDPLIQEFGGAAPYADDTVREWIKKVAPAEVSKARGRPKKNGLIEN